jgi:hypothetical protein
MSTHKIPKDDFVYQVVRDVVRKRGKVDTQEELCHLVVARLKKYNPDFVLSARRAKKIAIKIPEIKIRAKTKKAPKMKKIKKCPVCKSHLKKIYGTNLLNKKIHIGYLCKTCGFSTDLSSVVPMRYMFIWKD